jgi:flavin-dependent dehydrogenase
MRKYNYIVVGAGPAGLFACYELLKKKGYGSILLVDMGKRIEKRNLVR